MTEQICGECRFHIYDESSEDWICDNHESDNHGLWTGYTDSCDEWEGEDD